MASQSSAPHAPVHGSADTHASEEAHTDGAVHAHVAHPLFYVAIFGALIFLTIVTVAVSYVDLG
ncbi:MAG: hypothetical protein EOP08_15990, partial [Proteobacteria bacterium]